MFLHKFFIQFKKTVRAGMFRGMDVSSNTEASPSFNRLQALIYILPGIFHFLLILSFDRTSGMVTCLPDSSQRDKVPVLIKEVSDTSY